MPYLIFQDYKRQIQIDNLNQIIGNDLDVLNKAELQAAEEAKAYLTQKYDVTDEMQEVSLWDRKLATYKAGSRIYINASNHNPALYYINGALVIHAGSVYQCIANVTVEGPFDDTKWKLLGQPFDLFYAKYPEQQFSFSGIYKVGDKVFWKDKVYKCIAATANVTPAGQYQYGRYENVPLPNLDPALPQSVTQWTFVYNYNVPAYASVSDTRYWTAGDLRSQQLLAVTVDICLYHLHSRIAPRNIPELRVKRYDDAINWLRMSAEGAITPALPILQPRQGARIRYGGNVKAQNTY
jgi:phage gp36-like protein